MRFLLAAAILGSAILVSGCAPMTHPTPTPTPSPIPPDTPRPGDPPHDPARVDPGARTIVRAEPDAVTVRPGGEARVTLTGVPAGANIKVHVEPADRHITAIAERDTLVIQVGPEATGQATVTVDANGEVVRVRVTVEGT